MITSEILKKVKENGGLTLDINKNEVKKNNGYFYSMSGYETKISINNIDSFNNMLDKYIKIASNIENVNIGLWLNDGYIYIDLSIWEANKSIAIENGVYNDQIAIYDVANAKDIELKKYINIVYLVYKVKENNDLKYITEKDSVQEIANFLQSKGIKNYINDQINYNDLLNDNKIYNDNILILKDKKVA